MVEVSPGIHRIRLPLMAGTMGHVNTYLIEGTDGWWTLVDCGRGTADTLEALRRELRSLGLGLEDIRTLVATHHHSDHYGLAGTLVKVAKPVLLMHRLDWQEVRAHPPEATDDAIRETMAWMELNGLHTGEWAERERRIFVSWRLLTAVAPDGELEDGDYILGDRNLQVIWTPGHTPGHICLYDAGRRVLLAGDHVLESITPHVGIYRPDEKEPITGCLDALRRVAALDVEVVLPGHGDPFGGLAERAEELVAHHLERETQVLGAVAGQVVTAAEVAARIPWTRRRITLDRLPLPHQRLALGQTLAHLERLRGNGHVSRERRNGRVYFKRAC